MEDLKVMQKLGPGNSEYDSVMEEYMANRGNCKKRKLAEAMAAAADDHHREARA